MSDIRTNSPCCSVLVWASFCFVRLINKNVCSQTYPDAALIYIYIYSIQISPAALCHSPECLITVAITLLHIARPPPKKKSYYLLYSYKFYNIHRQNLWKYLKTPFLKNICVWLLLNWIYEVICNHLDSVILQKYQSLSNQSFKQFLAQMLSIYLTPTLSCEGRFRMFIR